jgi:hypothetical protein
VRRDAILAFKWLPQRFCITDILKVGQQYKLNAVLRFNNNNGNVNASCTLPIPLFRTFVTTVDFESKAVSVTVTSEFVQYSKSERFSRNWR